jgi:site-specific recombinase XerD
MDRNKATANEVIGRVLEDLTKQNYSNFTIGRYRHCYNGLRRYMEKLGQEHYTAKTGLDYISQKFGIEIEGLYGKHPANVRSTIRALQVLWDYNEYGSMVVKIRPGRKEFECPAQFSEEYNAFIDECRMRGYTPMGKTSLFSIIRKLLLFLNDAGVSRSSELTIERIHKFITSYSGCSTRYLATIISVLRNYLGFLFSKAYLLKDITPVLPKVKISRGGLIPSSWKKEDIQKLLSAIDRNNPEGKRDYAILLMVTRLGLRASDIRTLKLRNINWNRKEISIVMQKTKQPLTLPLLDDIGWALVDYLKNGRPDTVSDYVFIRHKAPYDGFSDHNCLSRMIGRRMSKAGIKMAGKHGLHSLRSTLARVMLENEAPLPVISAALGHQNIQTTSIYLSIDIEGLKKCALDPEEVCP